MNDQYLDSLSIADFTLKADVLAMVAPGQMVTDDFETIPDNIVINTITYDDVNASREEATVRINISKGQASKDIVGTMKFNIKGDTLALYGANTKRFTTPIKVATTTIATTDIDFDNAIYEKDVQGKYHGTTHTD